MPKLRLRDKVLKIGAKISAKAGKLGKKQKRENLAKTVDTRPLLW